MNKLGPSLMCTDLGRVEEEIRELDQAGVDFYHLDIMDGQFAPNFALSPDFVKKVRKLTTTTLDVHLMVENPERYIDVFIDSGADMLSVHAEATHNLQSILAHIQSRGVKAGVAINPATPLDVLDYVYDVTDYVVVMTVNPGFAGQQFIPATYEKIKRLHKKITDLNLDISIQVDGNIGAATIPQCIENGANLFVGGTSAVYSPEKSLIDNVKATKKLL